MGVLIVADAPPAGSGYDQWKVYRSSSQSGTYTLQTTQDITDLTYYDNDGTSSSWYKISYYNSSTTDESGQSDAIQGQSTIYTTVEKVRSLLQAPSWTDSTNPSIQEVVEIINRAEDIIDSETGHAWRLRYSGTQSGQETTAQYELYDIDSMYEHQSGYPIYLQHRKIKDFDADEGDALEFWNGAEWEDWLSTKTESRANDYWVDYEMGILYMRGYRWVNKPLGLRIKYRYGERYVNKDIEDICTKIVAIDVLTGMDPRAMIVQENSGVMTHDARASRWRDQIENRITRYREFQVPHRSL